MRRYTAKQSLRSYVSFIFASMILPAFCAIIGFTANVSATSHSATISASSSVILDVLPVGDGVGVHSESITVNTTCSAGYNLSIATSGDNKLYHGGDSTSEDYFNPINNTYALNDANNTNTWGVSLVNTPSTIGSFNPLSTTPLVVKTTQDTAGEGNIEDTFSLYYGAKADATLPAGSYSMGNSGSIVYYLTMDASCVDTIDITFLANASGDTVTNLPISSDNTYDSANNTITLSNIIPSREGYTFIEWNTSSDGNGISYAPGDVIAIGTGTGEINTDTDLYAIWQSSPAPSSTCNTPVTGATYMQDITSSNKSTILAGMTAGNRYYLRDSRDGKPYCVGKLADGNLWMLDNLALDPTDATTAANMSASNTNATAEAITNYLNGGNTNNTAGWSSTAVVNATSDSYIAPMINNASVDTLVTSYGLAAVNGQAKVGIYYNYCAATVGTYCYAAYSGVDVPDTIIDASQDICPAGWRMPTGGLTGEYNTLYGYYNTTQDATNSASLQYNLSTPLSGSFYDSSAGGQGSWGFWWSSTYLDDTNMYGLYVSSTDVDPTSVGDRSTGISVRCLVNHPSNPAHTITVSLDSHTTGVSFYNANYGTQSVSTNGGTVTLREGVTYTITASFTSGYELSSWSNGTNSTIGSSTTNPTTYTVTGTSILSVTSQVNLSPCLAGYICYNGNNADAGTMDNQEVTSNTATLIPSNFSRAGYGFAGWNTNADGTGTNYGPNQTITPGDLTSSGLNLYAKWLAPSGTLQTWAGASNMSVGDAIALRDNRDDEVYTVAKLADNKVWIVENLRLVPGTANITNKNTNNPTADFLSSYKPSSSTTTQCSSSLETCLNKVYYYTGNMNRSATQLPTGNTSDNAWYSYGTMYNWYTATAGNGTADKASGDVAGDICPAGWHLPNGGSNGEYKALATALGGTGSAGATNIRKYPNNFIWSGDYNPSTVIPDGRGTQARLWHGTASNSEKAYRMGYNSSGITPVNTYNKWDNFAVRCIYQGGNIHYTDVEVDFLGSGITSLTFTNNNYATETATPSNPTVGLVENVPYTVTATTSAGYEVASWATIANGVLGDSTTTNPAPSTNTYTISDEATLTVTGQEIPSYTVTVELGPHVGSISFSHPDYPTQTVTNANVGTNTNNGEDTGAVSLRRGITYTLSSSYESGYTVDTWTSTANGTLSSSNTTSTTYVVSGTATLSLSAQETSELTYTLVYNAGAGTDAPEGETISSFNASESFTITNSAPIYYGYTFTGWSETPVDSSNCNSNTENSSCNGTSVDYTSGNTINVSTTGASTTKTLYPVYTAVTTCPAGKICYYENGADFTNGGRGTMANKSATSNSTAKLIPTNYSREGYGFAGWTTAENATPYGPNATINTPDLSSTGLALYAKWVAPSGTLQSWTGCNAMTENSVIALTDTRDNNAYAVAKLADGNCWTIENLRLVPSTATITSQNTHNPASDFATAAANSSSSNSLCNTDDDSTCTDQLQYNTNSLDRSLTQSYYTAGNNVAWYSYGVYYNWYTATAGNGTFNTSANTNVTGDLCPKNWHLPTSTTSGEWVTLNNVVNGGVSNADAGLRAYPVNLIWSGDYNGSSRTSGYSNGRYWSSTGYDANNAYRMGHQESGNKGATPRGYYRKWDGFAIRCIRDEVVEYVNITVNLDAHTSSVGFYNATYGTEQAVNNNGNNDGTDTVTVSLVKGAPYTITASFDTNYELSTWAASTGSAVGSTTTNPTTYTATNTSTLSVTSQEYVVAPLVSSDCPANSICYAPNANNIIGNMSSLGMMSVSPIAGVQTTTSGVSGATSITASTTKIELIAPNYIRSGYGFAGWSTDYTANSSSAIYGPNETITITAGSLSPNGMILYPVWIASAGDMQEWNGCSGLTAASYNSSTGMISAALSSLTALTDTRDGNVYTIAKLADGKCWMVENLRLNAENTRGAENIAKAQGYGQSATYGNFIGLANSENDHFDQGSSPNEYYSLDGDTIVNVGVYDDGQHRIPRYNNNNTNNNLAASYNSSGGDTYYSWQNYGNYYNWPAAIASTKYYNTYSGVDGSDNAGTSLCPKGWQLPLGGPSTGTLGQGANNSANRVGGFSYLDRKMGGTGTDGSTNSATGTSNVYNWRTFPNNFIYSGGFSNSYSVLRGTRGYYLTRSAKSDNIRLSYALYMDEDELRPGTSDSEKNISGQTIRCISQ